MSSPRPLRIVASAVAWEIIPSWAILRSTSLRRRLVQRQLAHPPVEVHPRRRAHADRRLPAHGAVGHGVEVLGEHPVLVVDLLELLGQARLADLALEALEP